MKVNNLEQVLKECGLEELPQRNDRALFKYAIGLVETSAVSESYCILKMLDEKPCVKQIFVGGMVRSILAVFPYDFTGYSQPEQKVTLDPETGDVDLNDPNFKAPETLTPMLHESSLEDKIDADKKLEGDEYGGEWGIKTVTNPEEAKAWLREASKKGYPALFGKSNIKDEARLKEEFLKIVEEMKSM